MLTVEDIVVSSPHLSYFCALMLKTVVIFLLGVLVLVSCKTDFEAMRTSGDPVKMYAEANEYYENGDYDKAITLYELIVPSYRGKTEAEQLYFNYANAHFLKGSYILASHYFKTFSDTYTVSPKREEALYLKAISHYETSPKFRLDQTESEKAIEAFQLFVNTYPDSDKVEGCNTYIDELREKMEHKEFESGKMYYDTRNYSSAIQALENMLKDYPESNKMEAARYLIAKASYDLAQNSIYQKQEERFKKTVERCDSYIKKHKEASHSEEVMNFKEASIQKIEKIQNG